MRASLLGLTLLTLACGALACGSSSDSGTGPGLGSSLNGTYTLKTVDNKALPVAFADSSLTGGQLVMSDSGWSQISVVQYKAGGSANGDTLKLGGFWTANGTNITLFDFGHSTTYTGSYSSTGINLTTKTATLLSYSK
jgi:hypothetical protein